MKRYYLIITLCFTTCIIAFSQTGTLKVAKPASKDTVSIIKKKFWVSALCGYSWQGYNNAELGVMPTYYFKPKPENISLTLGCDFFKHHVTYVAPFANLKYSGIIHLGGFWGTLACNYSILKVNGITDQRLTPQIGFDWNSVLNISYGYNIPIAKEQIPFISPHKITIRMWHLTRLFL